MGTPFLWLAFNVFVLGAVALDLGVVGRRLHKIGLREAALSSLVWIALSGLFGVGVLHYAGHQKALEFFTGYLIEKALSVDNLFLFLVIFRTFAIDGRFQHRMLEWGILGALVMRGLMIWLGVALVDRFDFVLYFFGAFLLVSAWRMFFVKQEPNDFGESWVMRCCLRAFPITPDFHGEHFKAKLDGRWMLTPLALALIVIDVMDLVFAVDSIPAVFAITRDPFIVYTSNICAILGLRSLYFLLAKMVARFIYLKIGLAIVLAFIGAKMVTRDLFTIPTSISLAVVVAVLTSTIAVSMAATHRNNAPPKDSTP